jgi:hypothetical protein
LKRINIREKLRKIVVPIFLVFIVTIALVYALTRPTSGFAILTTPPPGIPGPYYVTAEAKIYGPVVDLSAIKNKTGGMDSADYTYVKWGTNPFYRVYVDNTLQEVYYGQMVDVMNAGALDLNSTFNNLLNVGAVSATSLLGDVHHSGNMPGSYIALNSFSGSFQVETSRFYAASASFVISCGFQFSWVYVYMNGCAVLLPNNVLNTTGGGAGVYIFNVQCTGYQGSATLYFQDIIDTNLTISQNCRVYTVIDSPGTGFVSKEVSPASPLIGSSINITVKSDLPSAKNVNLTDLYPNTFGWSGAPVTLEKYRVGVGLEASTSLGVTPIPDGSNMKIQINYDQAPSILQSLLGDEYIYVSYTLIAPTTSGEYTLPSASMSYSITLPKP